MGYVVSFVQSFWIQVVKLAIDTGRKLNVYKTFRRRPGRLLKVLYVRSIYFLCLLGWQSIGTFDTKNADMNKSIVA